MHSTYLTRVSQLSLTRTKQQSFFFVASMLLVSFGIVIAVDMPAWTQETSDKASKNQSQNESKSEQQPKPDDSVGVRHEEKNVFAESDAAPVSSTASSNSSGESKPLAQEPVKETATKNSDKPGDRPPPAGFDAAEKLYNAGKFALAQKAFEKFINSGVADVKTHLDLAYCLYYQRIYSRAMKEFDWVAKNAKLISMQRSAEATARTLRCYRAGICPANCLKANDPRWQRLPDKDPNELWIKFPYSGGWSAWSEHHIGQRIEYVNGKPENLGTCPVCDGTGTVPVLKDGAPLPH